MEGVSLRCLKPQSLEWDELHVKEEKDFGDVLERWVEKRKSRDQVRKALGVSGIKAGDSRVTHKVICVQQFCQPQAR